MLCVLEIRWKDDLKSSRKSVKRGLDEDIHRVDDSDLTHSDKKKRKKGKEKKKKEKVDETQCQTI